MGDSKLPRRDNLHGTYGATEVYALSNLACELDYLKARFDKVDALGMASIVESLHDIAQRLDKKHGYGLYSEPAQVAA